jgi:hypothetical protein
VQVQRWDRGSFRAVRSDNGWLRADATLTRTGVFPYRNADGTTRLELRLPDEVGNQDSLASLALVPVTKDHPPEKLDADNTKQYQVGTVGSDVRVDGSLVRATVQVTDAAAVAAVDAGSHRELSCGYSCELDMQPGTWQGQRYDAIQRHIKYNHVALTPLGRAGRDVKIHLDTADAIQDEPTTERRDTIMDATIRIDGVDYETTKQAAQAFTAYVEKRDAEKLAGETAAVAIKAEADKVQAKLDASTEELAKIKKERDDALAPERIAQAVRARVDLETAAAKVLGEEKLDALTDAEIRAKVIAKVAPEAKLDGKSADYVQARFDACLEVGKDRNDALGATRSAAVQTSTETRVDAAEARRRMMAEDDQRWQASAANTTTKS